VRARQWKGYWLVGVPHGKRKEKNGVGPTGIHHNAYLILFSLGLLAVSLSLFSPLQCDTCSPKSADGIVGRVFVFCLLLALGVLGFFSFTPWCSVYLMHTVFWHFGCSSTMLTEQSGDWDSCKVAHVSSAMKFLSVFKISLSLIKHATIYVCAVE
jgi:hypothetical protein